MTARHADPLGRRALLGCGGAVTLLMGLLAMGLLGYTAGLFALWHLPAYSDAMAEVQHSERARHLLGEPIRDGWFATVQLGRTDSDLMELRSQIPVHGSTRSATIYTAFERRDTGFAVTTVLLDVSGEVVDLLQVNEEEASESVADERLGLIEQVDVHIQADDLEAAREAADEAVALDPTNAATWVARSKVRRLTRDFNGALEDAQQAAKRAPNDSAAQLSIAEVHRTAEAWEDCIDVATERIQLEPRDGKAWTLRARCFAGQDLLRQALAGAREGCTRGDTAGCAYAQDLEAAH